MEPTNYKCQECGAVVFVTDNEIIRTCEHTESVIVADIQAVAYGIASVN